MPISTGGSGGATAHLSQEDLRALYRGMRQQAQRDGTSRTAAEELMRRQYTVSGGNGVVSHDVWDHNGIVYNDVRTDLLSTCCLNDVKREQVTPGSVVSICKKCDQLCDVLANPPIPDPTVLGRSTVRATFYAAYNDMMRDIAP